MEQFNARNETAYVDNARNRLLVFFGLPEVLLEGIDFVDVSQLEDKRVRSPHSHYAARLRSGSQHVSHKPAFAF